MEKKQTPIDWFYSKTCKDRKYIHLTDQGTCVIIPVENLHSLYKRAKKKETTYGKETDCS